MNAQTLAGTTPLFLARAANAHEAEHVLIEAGAVLEVINPDEVPPMEILEHTPRATANNLRGNDMMKWADGEMGVASRYTMF